MKKPGDKERFAFTEVVDTLQKSVPNADAIFGAVFRDEAVEVHFVGLPVHLATLVVSLLDELTVKFEKEFPDSMEAAPLRLAKASLLEALGRNHQRLETFTDEKIREH